MADKKKASGKPGPKKAVPAKKKGEELSMDDLNKVAGGLARTLKKRP